MRLAVTALAAALALLSVAACSSPGGGSSPASTLVVGEFNPFTGPDAAFGPEMVGGCIPAIRPAARDVNTPTHPTLGREP